MQKEYIEEYFGLKKHIKECINGLKFSHINLVSSYHSNNLTVELYHESCFVISFVEFIIIIYLFLFGVFSFLLFWHRVS